MDLESFHMERLPLDLVRLTLAYVILDVSLLRSGRNCIDKRRSFPGELARVCKRWRAVMEAFYCRAWARLRDPNVHYFFAPENYETRAWYLGKYRRAKSRRVKLKDGLIARVRFSPFGRVEEVAPEYLYWHEYHRQEERALRGGDTARAARLAARLARRNIDRAPPVKDVALFLDYVTRKHGAYCILEDFYYIETFLFRAALAEVIARILPLRYVNALAMVVAESRCEVERISRFGATF